MLTRMPIEGDKVIDINGDIQEITHVVGALAVTDRWLPDHGEFNMFIARFTLTGPVSGYEYNRNFTLVTDDAIRPRSICGESNTG